MFRHFPGRNQRSKSNKIKLGMKVCFLVAVCLWLMYQIRNSRSGLTIKIATDDTKLGRKDLKPKMKETVTTNEEQDDETVTEEEKNKLEDEEEQDLKSEKKYDAKVVDIEEDLMEDEENVLREKNGLDTKGRVRYTNTTSPLKIEESSAHQNAISGIESTTVVHDDAVDDGATFGDVTGLQTRFLNQTMDTDDKTAMIEDSAWKTEVADEIKQRP